MIETLAVIMLVGFNPPVAALLHDKDAVGSSSLTRQLVTTPITDAASLRTAIELYCSDVPAATTSFGEIVTWDTSAVGSMGYLIFSYCSTKSTFNADISAWDTSKVTEMDGMFSQASGFDRAVGAWDVSSVTGMSYMFDSASRFNQALGFWNVGSVTDMFYMFYSAQAFNQALETWDMRAVAWLDSMFEAAFAFNQPLSPWDIGGAMSLSRMFYQATAFNQDLCWITTSSAVTTNIFGSSPGSMTSDIASAACQCEPGTFSPNGAKHYTGGSSCSPCSSGTYSSASGTAGACETCSPGKASSTTRATASSTCLDCPGGRVSNLAGSACVPSGSCPAGSAEKSGACSLCTAGYYSAGGFSSCSPCPVGSFVYVSGASECLSCAVGKFAAVTGAATCLTCAPGSYASTLGSSVCEPCAPGTFASSAGSVCTSCAAGKATPAGALFCSDDCPAGYFKSASSCLGCQNGTMSSAKSTSCASTCPAGTFWQSGTVECWPCPAGTFAAASSTALFCTACAYGKVSPMGAASCGSSFTTTTLRTALTAWCGNSATAAVSYGDISVWDTSGVLSFYALFYTYCSSAATFDKDISAWDTSQVTDMYRTCRGANVFNQALNGWDTSKVTDMFAMFYFAYAFNQALSFWDTSKVTSMSYTFYKATAFNQALDTFQVGNVKTMYKMLNYASAFNQGLGSWDVRSVSSMEYLFQYSAFNQDLSAWDVRSVTSMKYMFDTTAFNQAICWNLGPTVSIEYMFQSAQGGTVTMSSYAAACQCLAGQYSVGGTRFSGAGDATPCMACEPGWFSATATSTQCTLCEAGKWSLRGVSSSTACFSCAAGTGWSSVSESCEMCAAGFYGPDASTGLCTLCKAGTYCSTSGASACTTCDQGKASSATGATSSAVCLACSAFQVSVADFSACVSGGHCPVGSYEDSALTTCFICQAGRYMAVASSFKGAAACLDCAAGKSSGKGAQFCGACGAGYASTSGGLCESCDPGTYSTEPGQVECQKCAAGKAGSIRASTTVHDCGICQSGRASAAGASTCTTCGAGYFAGNELTTMDDASTLVLEGAPLCIPCAAGYFSGNHGSITCNSCGAGTANPTPGSVSCGECAAGKASASTAATCSDCSPGSFKATSGLGLCDFCASGRFAFNSGSTGCLDCSAGTAQGATGGSSCPDCPAGSFSAAPGSSSCSDCPGNDYSTAGAVSCTLCLRGFYFSIDATCEACPQGVICSDDGGTTQGELRLDQGYWRISPLSVDVQACPLSGACVGGAGSVGAQRRELRDEESFGDRYCAKGYKGPLCGECDPSGFYFNPDTSTCAGCSDGGFAARILSSPRLVLLLVAGFLGAAGAVAVYFFGNVAPLEPLATHYDTKRVQQAVAEREHDDFEAFKALAERTKNGHIFQGTGGPVFDKDTGSVTFSRTKDCSGKNKVRQKTTSVTATSYATVTTIIETKLRSVGEVTVVVSIKPSKLAKTRLTAQKLAVKFKSITAFGQIVVNVGFNCAITFPDVYTRLLRGLAIVNLDFLPSLGLRCVFRKFTYIGEMLVETLFPLAVAAVLLAVYFAAVAADGREHRVTRAQHEAMAELYKVPSKFAGYLRPGEEKELRRTFAHFDKDGNGILSRSELEDVVMELHPKWAKDSTGPSSPRLEGMIEHIRSPRSRPSFTTSRSMSDSAFELFNEAEGDDMQDFDFAAFLKIVLSARRRGARAASDLEHVVEEVESMVMRGRGQLVISLFLFLTFMILINTSTTLFHYFKCQSFEIPEADGGGTKRFLSKDYSIDCDSPEYKAYLIYAAAFIFVYPVGIPLLYASLLFLHRGILTDASNLDVEDSLGQPTVGHITFLYKSYKPQYYWFEVVECIRRLLLASVVGMASADSAAAAVLGVLICLGFTVVSNHVAPFKQADDNRLGVTFAYSLTFVFLAALVIKAGVAEEQAQDEDQRLFGALLIVVVMTGPCAVALELVCGLRLPPVPVDPFAIYGDTRDLPFVEASVEAASPLLASSANDAQLPRPCDVAAPAVAEKGSKEVVRMASIDEVPLRRKTTNKVPEKKTKKEVDPMNIFGGDDDDDDFVDCEDVDSEHEHPDDDDDDNDDGENENDYHDDDYGGVKTGAAALKGARKQLRVDPLLPVVHRPERSRGIEMATSSFSPRPARAVAGITAPE